MSDDQGYGDLSIHGNPHLKTPAIDSIATAGMQFTQFHVSPVCSPTRSSLLTGRYNYRTGVVDTFLGRSMMHAEELTIAEVLRGAGYRTGIFGKWHLGDNYPLRAVDQGFDESLVHRGGGLAQPAGRPGEGYFDAELVRNGVPGPSQGYCTDVFFDAARGFLEANRNRPFFSYIATNAPHTPLQVEERFVEPFRKAGLDEVTAKVYGMVVNLDQNVARLLATLRRLDLERDTLLFFLTDNGPQQRRYNAGMRALKGTVYQGGIRVPGFLRWPARVAAGGKCDRIAAHIDLFPTICDACSIPLPKDRQIDGRSLLPLATSATAAQQWPDRKLFFQWHRGDAPEPFRAAAVRSQRWKLVDGKELYDLENDPAEATDVSSANPTVVGEMRKAYTDWFADVSATRGYAPPRIHLGTPHENPVTLTRQDWRGTQASWDGKGRGHWEVDVKSGGPYQVRLEFPALAAGVKASFRLGSATAEAEAPAGATEVVFSRVSLPSGPGRLEAWLGEGPQAAGPHYVHLSR